MDAVPAERPRNHETLNLTGPLVDRRYPDVAEVTLDRKLARVAVAAVNLNGAVANLDGGLGGIELCDRRRARKGQLSLLAPGGAQGEQAGCLQSSRRVRQCKPDCLEIGDGAPKLL